MMTKRNRNMAKRYFKFLRRTPYGWKVNHVTHKGVVTGTSFVGDPETLHADDEWMGAFQFFWEMP